VYAWYNVLDESHNKILLFNIARVIQWIPVDRPILGPGRECLIDRNGRLTEKNKEEKNWRPEKTVRLTENG